MAEFERVGIRFENQGLSAFLREVETARRAIQGIVSLAGRKITLKTEVDSKAATAALDQVDRLAGGLNGKRVSMTVDADIRSALQGLNQVESSLIALSGAQASVELQASSQDALQAIQQIETLLLSLQGGSASISVTTDVQAAMQALDLISDRLREIQGAQSAIGVTADVESALQGIAQVETALRSLNGATATVSVQAETLSASQAINQIITDIAALNGATATVGVTFGGQSATGGIDQVAQQLQSLNGATVTVGVLADVRNAIQELQRVEEVLSRLSGSTVAVSAIADVRLATQALDQLEQRLAALQGAQATVSVTGEITNVQQAISTVETALVGLQGAQSTVVVTADVESALQSIARVEAALRALGGAQSTVVVTAEVASALQAINRVEESLRTLQGNTATIGVTADTQAAQQGIAAVAGKLAQLDGAQASVRTNAITRATIDALSNVQTKIKELEGASADIRVSADTRSASQAFAQLTADASAAGSQAGSGFAGGVIGGLSTIETVVAGFFLQVGASAATSFQRGFSAIGSFIERQISGSLIDSSSFEQNIANLSSTVAAGVIKIPAEEAKTRLEDLVTSIATSPTLIAAEDTATAALRALLSGGFTLDDAEGGQLAAAVQLQNLAGVQGSVQEYNTAGQFIARVAAQNGLAVEDSFRIVQNATGALTQSSITDLDGLLFAYGNAAAAARALGVSLEEQTAVFVAGSPFFRSERELGTAVENFLFSLAAPTEAQAAAFQELGLAAFDAQGNFVGLAKVQEQLQAAVESGNFSQQEQAALLRTGFGAFGIQLANALVASEDIDTILTNLESVNVAEVLEQRTTTTANAFQNLGGILNALRRQITADFTESLRPVFFGLGELFQALSPQFATLGDAFAAFTQPAVASLVTLIEYLTQLAQSGASIGQIFQEALAVITGVLDQLGGAAITNIAQLLGFENVQFDTVSQAFAAIGDSIQTNIIQPVTEFIAQIQGIASTIQTVFGFLTGGESGAGLGAIVENLGKISGIADAFGGFGGLGQLAFGNAGGAVGGVLDNLIGQSPDSAGLNAESGTIRTTLDTIATEIREGVTGIQTAYEEGGIAGAFGQIVEEITTGVAELTATIINGVAGVFTNPETLATVSGSVSTLASGLIQGITGALTGVGAGVDALDTDTIGRGLGGLVSAIIDGLTTTLNDPKLPTALAGALTGLTGSIFTALTGTLGGIGDAFAGEDTPGLADLAGSAVTFVARFVDSLVGAIAQVDFINVAQSIADAIGRASVGIVIGQTPEEVAAETNRQIAENNAGAGGATNPLVQVGATLGRFFAGFASQGNVESVTGRQRIEEPIQQQQPQPRTAAGEFGELFSGEGSFWQRALEFIGRNAGLATIVPVPSVGGVSPQGPLDKTDYDLLNRGLNVMNGPTQVEVVALPPATDAPVYGPPTREQALAQQSPATTAAAAAQEETAAVIATAGATVGDALTALAEDVRSSSKSVVTALSSFASAVTRLILPTAPTTGAVQGPTQQPAFPTSFTAPTATPTQPQSRSGDPIPVVVVGDGEQTARVAPTITAGTGETFIESAALYAASTNQAATQVDQSGTATGTALATLAATLTTTSEALAGIPAQFTALVTGFGTAIASSVTAVVTPFTSAMNVLTTAILNAATRIASAAATAAQVVAQSASGAQNVSFEQTVDQPADSGSGRRGIVLPQKPSNVQNVLFEQPVETAPTGNQGGRVNAPKFNANVALGSLQKTNYQLDTSDSGVRPLSTRYANEQQQQPVTPPTTGSIVNQIIGILSGAIKPATPVESQGQEPIVTAVNDPQAVDAAEATAAATAETVRQQQRLVDVTTEGNAQQNTASQEIRSLLGNVTGLFSRSQVTAVDVQLSQEGAYQNKPDEFLRRLQAQAEGGGAEFGDLAGQATAALERVGIQGSSDLATLYTQISEAWQNGILFSAKENLSLIDTEAVQSQIDLQTKAAEGKENVYSYLASVLDTGVSEITGSTGGLAGVAGLTGVQPTEQTEEEVESTGALAESSQAAATGLEATTTNAATAASSLDGTRQAAEGTSGAFGGLTGALGDLAATIGDTVAAINAELLKLGSSSTTITPVLPATDPQPTGSPKQEFARGTRFFNAQAALVGEEGPELVIDQTRRRAFLVGTEGQEVRSDIPQGAAILTAQETQRAIQRGLAPTSTFLPTYRTGRQALEELLRAGAKPPMPSLPKPTQPSLPKPTSPVTTPTGNRPTLPPTSPILTGGTGLGQALPVAQLLGTNSGSNNAAQQARLNALVFSSSDTDQIATVSPLLDPTAGLRALGIKIKLLNGQAQTGNSVVDAFATLRGGGTVTPPDRGSTTIIYNDNRTYTTATEVTNNNSINSNRKADDLVAQLTLVETLAR